MALPCPARSFDLVVCQFGVMFFPTVSPRTERSDECCAPAARSCSTSGTTSTATSLPGRDRRGDCPLPWEPSGVPGAHSARSRVSQRDRIRLECRRPHGVAFSGNVTTSALPRLPICRRSPTVPALRSETRSRPAIPAASNEPPRVPRKPCEPGMATGRSRADQRCRRRCQLGGMKLVAGGEELK